MKKSFAFEIDTETVPHVSDEYLAAQWYGAQFLPVKYGDRDACEAVRAIGAEIIKRWMQSQPIPMFNIQPHDHWREHLCRLAAWDGTEWTPRVAQEKACGPASDQSEGA